jgi:hypothetical protein
MSELAIAHDRKQPGATMPAKVDHVVFVFAKFGNALLIARQLKLFLANATNALKAEPLEARQSGQ